MFHGKKISRRCAMHSIGLVALPALSSHNCYNANFGDYSPEELEVSVFVSTGGSPVGLRLGAPSYSDELSGLGRSRTVLSGLATGFFLSAGAFFASTCFSSICVMSLGENGS